MSFKNQFFLKKYFFQSFGFFLIVLLASSLLIGLSGPAGSQVWDSQNMLNGRLYDDYIDVTDRIVYNDKAYSNQLPFPAVLFLPITFLMQLTGILNLWKIGQLILMSAIVYLSWKFINLKFGEKSFGDRLWFLLAFFGSSIVFNLYVGQGYLTHPVTTILLLLALIEYFSKKRLYLIGLYFGLLFLTRQTALGGLLFFILSEFSLILEKGTIVASNLKEYSTKIIFKVSQILFQLTIFSLLAIPLIWAFNYIRFGSVDMNTVIPNAVALTYEDTGSGKKEVIHYSEIKNWGGLSPKYIPGNLYFMLIHPGYYNVDKSYEKYYSDLNDPETKKILKIYKYVGFSLKPPYLVLRNDISVNFGIGILIGTPYLLYLFGGKYTKKEDWFLIITILPIFLFLLCFGAVGASQYSARYTLDFFPFLFLLFLNQVKDKFTTNLKVIILCMVLFNFWMVMGNYFN